MLLKFERKSCYFFFILKSKSFQFFCKATTGHGLGGRNQELALAAAPALAGLRGCCVFSVGSDGTDGPTDAAGGYTDGEALAALTAAGLDVPRVLADNDAYHALQAVGGLIMTGPTGTNVNDVAVVLTE